MVFKFSTLLMAAVTSLSFTLSAAAEQYYEVRSYLLDEKSNPELIDQYLSKALLPALERQGIGPVGVLSTAPQDQTGSPRIVVVIPYDDAAGPRQSAKKLQSDEAYHAAAAEYLACDSKTAPYKRIQSELLVGMDCMPELNVPAGTLENSDRIYELRLYESANERLGDLKVEMFNAGEVPIFLDCKIDPIFIGQCVVGPQTPSLTYLTVYASEQARGEAWKAFRVHPDWKVLSKNAKYKGTVSKIDKFVLMPKPYSKM